jgi:hypothetical protein
MEHKDRKRQRRKGRGEETEGKTQRETAAGKETEGNRQEKREKKDGEKEKERKGEEKRIGRGREGSERVFSFLFCPCLILAVLCWQPYPGSPSLSRFMS